VPADEIYLSIVIPAFNEERRLPATLQRLTEFLRAQSWTWEIRVIDDGSKDGTARVTEEFARTTPGVVVQREPHRGKGGAVRAGLTAALGQYRFMCDADLSMPPDEIPRFLPPAQSAFDVAIGSRERTGAQRVGEPLRRHIMGRIFNYTIQILVARGISDTQCGFKMFTAASVRAIFPHTTLDGWAFDVEVLCIARALGLRIVEVPIDWHHRNESQVSMVRDSWRMLRDVLKVRARMRRNGLVGPQR